MANLFPILVVFGALGLGDFPVDTSIAMTASVALGIAVDDTTHFLIRFREFGGTLTNVSEPLSKSIRQCGPAMLHTTLIAGSAIGIYGFSELLVMSRFSSVITILLLIAIVADIVILPAILFWANRFFQPDDQRPTVINSLE